LKAKSNSLAEIKLKPNSIFPFFSDGSWSLYQLLSHVLIFTGKANVKISSFSISENAVRSFINDKEKGLIHDMVLLFDISIPKRKFDLMLFAHNAFLVVRLAPNHSKVIVISGDLHNAVIISSQNLTPNPRLEAGCIFTCNEHFEYYNNMFDTYFSKAIPFDPFPDE
jgi:hypothetical protein